VTALEVSVAFGACGTAGFVDSVVGAAGGGAEVVVLTSLVVGCGAGGGAAEEVVGAACGTTGVSFVGVGSGWTCVTGSGVLVGSAAFSDDFVTTTTGAGVVAAGVGVTTATVLVADSANPIC